MAGTSCGYTVQLYYLSKCLPLVPAWHYILRRGQLTNSRRVYNFAYNTAFFLIEKSLLRPLTSTDTYISSDNTAYHCLWLINRTSTSAHASRYACIFVARTLACKVVPVFMLFSHSAVLLSTDMSVEVLVLVRPLSSVVLITMSCGFVVASNVEIVWYIYMQAIE